jgi:phosphoribosylanthranilate isomerase
MRKTKVKICGINDVETALEAQNCGADYIGLVFCKKSKRCISVERAEEIILALKKHISVVALFSNDDDNYIKSIISKIKVDLIQFHGDEEDEKCTKFNFPYFKGISSKNNENEDLDKKYPHAEAFIIDSHDSDGLGGTGKTFDWSKNSFNTTKPIIIAGGLNCDNVEDAIKTFLPYGVDVSSGVESSFGNKDTNLIREFIKKVKNEI